jgi:hypothetical protein
LDPVFVHALGRSQVPVDEVNGQVEGLPVEAVHLADLNLQKRSLISYYVTIYFETLIQSNQLFIGKEVSRVETYQDLSLCERSTPRRPQPSKKVVFKGIMLRFNLEVLKILVFRN